MSTASRLYDAGYREVHDARLQGQAQLLLHVLHTRFGNIDATTRNRIAGATTEEITPGAPGSSTAHRPSRPSSPEPDKACRRPARSPQVGAPSPNRSPCTESRPSGHSLHIRAHRARTS